MTKRTRALAGLTAGVLAVSAMAFGFSKWSSEVDLNGTVSANGKWEVAVTAASANISSTGAEMGVIHTESSYTVVTYPVYVDYKNNYYSFRIGDDEAAETKISYTDFTAHYANFKSTYVDEASRTGKSIGVSKFGSGAKSGDYTFVLNVADGYENIVENWYNRSSLKATDGGASDGQQIGTAIAWCYKGSDTNTPDNDKIKLTWADANAYFAENPSSDATETTDAKYEVTVYPITLVTSNGYYAYQVDDLNPAKVAMTKAQLDAYSNRVELNRIYDPASKEYRRFASLFKVSNSSASSMTMQISYVDGFDASGFATTNGMSNAKAVDGDAYSTYLGQQIGSAILRYVGGYSTTTSENPNMSAPDWKQANDALTANPSTTTNLSATINDNSVTYAPVTFTLPEAWANYNVTITNNGTVNANLSDYKVETSLDGETQFDDVFEVTTPEFGKDEVLAPGESCTFNVVVKAKNGTDNSIESDTGSFTITLSYVQDEVEAAPAVSHTHAE